MIIKNGANWRIGWNENAEKYKGLIGTEKWAVEITEAEFNDFCRLLQQLIDTVNRIKTELMEAEKIACEAETELLWMEIEGYADSYSLRLILNRDRRCEGNWEAGVASELAAAISSLKVF